MDRVDSMQEQTDRNPKNQKIKARNKKKKTEMKNGFRGLISRLDMTEKRISELDIIIDRILKNQEEREQRLKKEKEKNKMSKDCGKVAKSIILYLKN